MSQKRGSVHLGFWGPQHWLDGRESGLKSPDFDVPVHPHKVARPLFKLDLLKRVCTQNSLPLLTAGKEVGNLKRIGYKPHQE